MDAYTQLFSFFVSFCFGIFFHFLSFWHFDVVKRYPVFVKYISTFLFIVDVVLSYVIMMYHLNDGVIHIYFIIFVFLGFFVYGVLHKHVKLKEIMSRLIAKWKC